MFTVFPLGWWGPPYTLAVAFWEDRTFFLAIASSMVGQVECWGRSEVGPEL